MSNDLTLESPTTLRLGDRRFSCVIGKGGLSDNKREGDGATPRGTYALREVLYRPDRTEAPVTDLLISVITPEDGWCDDPKSDRYNERVLLPFDASHEKLWREDHAYDMFIVIGYNDSPVEKGKGSAIFLHLMHDDKRPTEGCIAVTAEDMHALLPLLSKQSKIHIL